MAVSPTAIVLLGKRGLAIARRAAAALDNAQLHGFAPRLDEAGVDVRFHDPGTHLAALFRGGVPVVGICAAGILVRALAPLLADKSREPPVLALSEDGAHIVPLLGGHRGANKLARQLARALGGRAAITTAGDTAFGLAFDEPPPGWTLANPESVKSFAAALLNGEKVRTGNFPTWLADSTLPVDDDGALTITISERRMAAPTRTLVYHPRRLALGIGCARGAAPEDAIRLAEAVCAEGEAAEAALACVVSLDLKADEPAVHAVAKRFRIPARFFSADRLEAETPRLANPSQVVFDAVGCHGVSEAAALAAAGDGSALIVPKRVAGSVTAALARAEGVINPQGVGAPQGRLAIVGLGPGAAHWRTPEAAQAIDEAEDVIGYSLYLDLLGEHLRGQRRHDFPLGCEEARARHALTLAAQGRRVALVSSGDPGIYAMAALVFECLDGSDRADWRRVAISVIPGVSALQAAAARAGAPIGHDFCAISLSDLMTPWDVIEKRLRAAAEADFVVALYNPVSVRRPDRLDRARDCLLTARPPETPVVLARNLGRKGETVQHTTLFALDAEEVDMLTLVLVGATNTRAIDRTSWIYTPRGYRVTE